MIAVIIIISVLLTAGLLACLRFSAIVEEHEQIQQDAEYEKY